MEAQTVTWLVFLVLIKPTNVSTSDPGITVKYPPTEPKLSMSSEVTEGQTITISCTAESFPQSTLTLIRTDPYDQTLIITETYHYSRPINSLSHEFTVTSVDAGWYVCRALNTEGVKDSKQKKLVVKYSPKHVTFQANPGLDVVENVSLTLSCSVESNPPVSSVTWRKTTDGREEIIQQTQTQTFTVNSAGPSDSGLYSCEATNDIGSGKSQPAEVKVRFSPKHTHITESAENQELDGRSSVMLSCFSHSFPPVQHYSWYRKSQDEGKDELVSEHQNHTVYSNQPGVYYCIAQNEAGHSLSDPVRLFEHRLTEPILSMRSEVTEGQTITVSCTAESFPQSTLTLIRTNTHHETLIIKETYHYSRPINSLSHEFTVTSVDAGWYVCRALNTEGVKDSKPKELVVKFSPKHTHITESAENQELDGRSSVMLSCFSHSFPPVQHYSWYRKSQGEERMEIVSKHQNHTVYSNQPGVYYCTAQNEAGHSLSDPVRLFEHRLTEPILSMRSEVTEGQTITVSCTAESFPQSTLTLIRTNTHHETLIIKETYHYSRPINSLSHEFTVTSVDAGWYVCRALNTEGVKDSKPKELVVKYSPKHVTFQANPSLDVVENMSLTLSCSFESNPPVSSVTWRKTTDWREEIIQQTQTQTFTVNSAGPSDSGLYSCEATNDIGSGKSQPAEVKVRFSPKHTHITESAENQELDGRSSVMLSCFSHSFPPVQHYSWYRKSQGEGKDEHVSEHQNHTVYSNQPGVYYCIAQNEAGHSLSDPVRLFEQ
ncbi:B-cell receptor CD22 isoform X2 [Pleuronectes platessa]|uniref:B-cell receptor CD22 isoform X2 n=2 Tax=Pleuronectes platessa TaxID=8262 RepID=UPI00232A79F8|nr:B-cell receptor CD22 isoform X2 [Pleuronectes platessa]